MEVPKEDRLSASAGWIEKALGSAAFITGQVPHPVGDAGAPDDPINSTVTSSPSKPLLLLLLLLLPTLNSHVNHLSTPAPALKSMSTCAALSNRLLRLYSPKSHNTTDPSRSWPFSFRMRNSYLLQACHQPSNKVKVREIGERRDLSSRKPHNHHLSFLASTHNRCRSPNNEAKQNPNNSREATRCHGFGSVPAPTYAPAYWSNCTHFPSVLQLSFFSPVSHTPLLYPDSRRTGSHYLSQTAQAIPADHSRPA
jgi:hypothetical protein